MSSVIQEFMTPVTDPDGHAYSARAVGRQRKNRTVWEGWLEFTPQGGRGIVRSSPIETTQPNREALEYWASGLEPVQPNREALEYWASGLEPVYLEGALERAIASRSDSRARSR